MPRRRSLRPGAGLLLLLASGGALQGCAAARWQVPMNAMEGQSETQQREAAEECDSLAKTSSRYDRGTEALAWLLVPPAAIALISTAIVVELLDLLTFRLFRLQDATRNAVTKIEKGYSDRRQLVVEPVLRYLSRMHEQSGATWRPGNRSPRRRHPDAESAS